MKSISVEDANIPPIVKELAGDDPIRLGILAHAYQSLWAMCVCGENGNLKDGFEQWVTEPQHAWLEVEPGIGELTPLIKLRL
jgi:hypothetical protein